MEPQPPSPALSRKVMPPEPLPKGSARCLDPHARAMVSGAGGCRGHRDPPGRAGPGPRGERRAPGMGRGGSRAAEAGPRLTAPRLCPQSQPDGEPLPGGLEKEDARSAPSTPSTPSVCSPPSSSSSSTPSAGKNVCSSCGLEILDRYLLKVSGGGGGGGGGGRAAPGLSPLLAAGEQPHLACPLPRVLRVPHLAAAAAQLLHQEQGDLLQDGLLQVGAGPPGLRGARGERPRRERSSRAGPGAAGEGAAKLRGRGAQSPGAASRRPGEAAAPRARPRHRSRSRALGGSGPRRPRGARAGTGRRRTAPARRLRAG